MVLYEQGLKINCLVEVVERNAHTWPVTIKRLVRKVATPLRLANPHWMSAPAAYLKTLGEDNTEAPGEKEELEVKCMHLWGKPLSWVQLGKPSTLASTGPSPDGQPEPGTGGKMTGIPPEDRKWGHIHGWATCETHVERILSYEEMTASEYPYVYKPYMTPFTMFRT